MRMSAGSRKLERSLADTARTRTSSSIVISRRNLIHIRRTLQWCGPLSHGLVSEAVVWFSIRVVMCQLQRAAGRALLPSPPSLGGAPRPGRGRSPRRLLEAVAPWSGHSGARARWVDSAAVRWQGGPKTSRFQ
jgi:hypothetical protein